MRFVLACYGTRGDVEPCLAVGRELLRRGHEVRTAVPPNLVGFAESAGIVAVPYGLDTQAPLEAQRNMWTFSFRTFWRIQDVVRSWREVWEHFDQCWTEMSTQLTSLANEADLLFTGLIFEQPAANVAEYYDIPLATLHGSPVRVNSQLLSFLPSPLARSVVKVSESLTWRITKKVEDAQRRQLGLTQAKSPSARRIAERGSLEIQAYDEVCFPGLAAEWAKWYVQRPFIGTLTLELPTDIDDEIASWIAAGPPPICFCFGSIAVESPDETLVMISAACAQLGERALVCGGGSDFSHVPHSDHVKVVSAMNYTATFRACRAIVHHGGAGTTAAGLRAGVPILILWTNGAQPYWGAVVKRLKVGTARRLLNTTPESLIADLRVVLAPQSVARAHEIASLMSNPAESIESAADLLEDFARLRRIG